MLKMWRAFNGSPGSLKCIFVHGAFVRICSVFFFFKGDTFEMSSPKWLFTARFFGRFREENPPLRVQYAERTRWQWNDGRKEGNWRHVYRIPLYLSWIFFELISMYDHYVLWYVCHFFSTCIMEIIYCNTQNGKQQGNPTSFQFCRFAESSFFSDTNFLLMRRSWTSMGMLVRLDGSHEMGRKGVGCVTLATSHTPIIALSKGILGMIC